MSIKECNIIKTLKLEEGKYSDYMSLAWCHYLDSALGPYSAIYTLRSDQGEVAGVIVYSMPSRGLALRNIATDGFFSNIPRTEQLNVLNQYFRRISRVIIEPRYRGLGLASRLVRMTMPMLKVPFIEALAVMGHVNNFFARAGMTGFTAPAKTYCVRLQEALSTVGIENNIFFDADEVQKKIYMLDTKQMSFLELEIKYFLKPYPRMRYAENSIDRTSFILSKLNARAVYYIKKID